MLFLISTIVLAFLSFKTYSFIKKNNVKLYILFAGLAGLDIFFQFYLYFNRIRLQGLVLSLESFFSRGILGTALISVVMLIGAFDNRHHVVKKLRSIRTELSIIACMLMAPHNIYYAYLSYSSFFKVLASKPSAFRSVSLSLTIIGILTILILIPLFITSFISIRKRMPAKNWKNLQRWAYPFYFLIYLQILLTHLGFANRRSYLDAIAYSLIFVPYAILRLRKYISTKAKKTDMSRPPKAGSMS